MAIEGRVFNRRDLLNYGSECLGVFTQKTRRAGDVAHACCVKKKDSSATSQSQDFRVVSLASPFKILSRWSWEIISVGSHYCSGT